MLGKHFFDKISCGKRFLESLVENKPKSQYNYKQIDKAQEGCK